MQTITSAAQKATRAPEWWAYAIAISPIARPSGKRMSMLIAAVMARTTAAWRSRWRERSRS